MIECSLSALEHFRSLCSANQSHAVSDKENIDLSSSSFSEDLRPNY